MMKNNDVKDRFNKLLSENKGRFPANLALSHHPDCEYKGEKKVEGGNDPRRSDGMRDGNAIFKNTKEQKSNHKGYSDENGMETVSDWDCHPSCPVRRMNEQSDTAEAWGESTNGQAEGEGSMFKMGGKNAKRYDQGGGGPARFFNQFHFRDEDFFRYTAKASKSERTCDGNVDNDHPTVKPLELMEWLIRLVTPPEGVVVDPFCGSGTTLIAAYEQGVDYIGLDKDEDSVEIARERLDYHQGPKQKELV